MKLSAKERRVVLDGLEALKRLIQGRMTNYERAGMLSHSEAFKGQLQTIDETWSKVSAEKQEHRTR